MSKISNEEYILSNQLLNKLKKIESKSNQLSEIKEFILQRLCLCIANYQLSAHPLNITFFIPSNINIENFIKLYQECLVILQFDILPSQKN